MVVKWNIVDPVASTSTDFFINPNAGGAIEYARNLTATPTVGTFGQTVLFEGALVTPTIQFSGTILTSDEFSFFVNLWVTQNQVTLTDDLGNANTVMVTKFTPVRVRMASNPWMHTYTVEATVVNWP